MLDALARDGVLLLTDARLPSVAGIVAGAPVRGSWWAHARAHEIFGAVRRLASHADAVVAPLVDGKVTFIHRSLWPALVTVALARDRWQLSGLSREARTLLRLVDAHDAVRTDALRDRRIDRPGDAARELEKRLLVRGEEIHTRSGAHAKQLEAWDAWRRRVACVPLSSPQGARETFDELIQRWNVAYGAAARPPWARARPSPAKRARP